MWTKKTSKKFAKVIASLLVKPRINLEAITLVFKNYSKLLNKFLSFSSCRYPDEGLYQYVRAGINRSICPVCNAKFLHRSTGVTKLSICCRLCQNTPEGRKEVLMCKQKTCLKKYGVKNPGQSEEIKEKMLRTCRKTLGVDYPFQSEKVKEKIKDTLMDRYKVSNISKSKKHQAKKEKTCLKNYGVKHPLQSPELRLKSSISADRLWEVKTKKRKYLVEGYEKFIVDTLENKFDIVSSQFDKDFKPITLNNILYWPDFYIPKSDLYIEIKSTYTLYTLKSEFILNKIKALESIEKGYNLKWAVVFNTNRKDQHYILLPKYWFKMSKKLLIAYVNEKKKRMCFHNKCTKIKKFKG